MTIMPHFLDESIEKFMDYIAQRLLEVTSP
jgi:hypothetical protein